jgi:hypothetical protein
MVPSRRETHPLHPFFPSGTQLQSESPGGFVNINYVFIAIGGVSMVAGLIWRDWLLLFAGCNLVFSGWVHRNTQPSPWVKHPSIRDNTQTTSTSAGSIASGSH